MPSYARRDSFPYEESPLGSRRASGSDELDKDYYDYPNHPLDTRRNQAHDHNDSDTRRQPDSRRRRHRHRYDDNDDDGYNPIDRFPRARSRGVRILDALEAGTGLGQAMQLTKRERHSSPDSEYEARSHDSDSHYHGGGRGRHRRSTSVSPDSTIEDPRWHRERERGRSRARARSYDGSAGYANERGRLARHHSQQPLGSSSSTRLGKQAARAAILAGVVEAWRVRGERGPWIGQKGSRVATAALGSAAIDASLASLQSDRHAGRHAFASTVGGMVVNRLANGKR